MKETRFIVSWAGQWLGREYPVHSTIPRWVLVSDVSIAWRFDTLEKARGVGEAFSDGNGCNIVEVNA